MTGKELVKRYERGERNFEGANLSGAVLRGADLTNAKVTDEQLAEAIF